MLTKKMKLSLFSNTSSGVDQRSSKPRGEKTSFILSRNFLVDSCAFCLLFFWWRSLRAPTTKEFFGEKLLQKKVLPGTSRKKNNLVNGSATKVANAIVNPSSRAGAQKVTFFVKLHSCNVKSS